MSGGWPRIANTPHPPTVLTRNPLSSRGPARDLRHQPTTQLPPLTHTTTSLIPPPCRPRKPPHEVRSILGWTNQPQEKEGWGSTRPEPRRRILRAEREGSFLVTATVLTHNRVIPRPREGSKAPAHHPAPSSSTTPPTLPPCRPREPPHKVRLILGWTNQPQEKEGWGSARPEPRRRISRAERGGVIPRGRPPSATSPLHHPNSPQQHPTQPLSPTL